MGNKTKGVPKSEATSHTGHIQHLDPCTLEPHPAIMHVPALCNADYAVLKESISAERRVLEPLLINAEHQVIDGRHRLKAACDCDPPLETVPCLLSNEDPVKAAFRTALARRQLSETAKVLMLLECHPTLLKGRKARRLTNLNRKKPQCFPEAVPVGIGEPKGFNELAARYHLERDYFSTLARAIEELSPEEWAPIRARIFEGKTHAKGLAAGIEGVKATRNERPPIQPFNLLRRAFISVRNQIPHWKALESEERRELIDLYREIKTVLPKDLQ